MDTKERIQKHSQEKLLVYKKYLINYLSVLTNQSYYNQIFIWDIFAGKGKDDAGTEGSSIIAAKAIEDFRKEKGKDIQLFLNELNDEYFKQLKINLNEYVEFTNFYQGEGEDFLKKIIERLKNKNEVLNFFFIDPWGYTQYSTDTLKKLLNLKKSEYLIFIPTSHIYRFTNVSNENKPSAKFVQDLGVEHKDFKNAESFIKELESIFKKIANSEYIYSYKIEKREKKNSFHHLFFITKHIKGAEKFLQAKNKVKENLPQQITLFDNLDKENEIKNYLTEWRTNEEIYEWGIKNALLSKDINPILTELENKGKLEFGGEERKKGSFYLSNSPKKKIKIKLK